MALRKQGEQIQTERQSDFPELPVWDKSANLQASIQQYTDSLRAWWWRAREVLNEKSGTSTDSLVEGVNLFFTQKRARESLSVSAPLTYNTLDGRYGISKADAATNGYLSSADWSLFNGKVSFTNALARAAISATSPVSYDSGTGVISFTGSGYTATSLTLTAGAGLTGGGDLSANRTFAIDFTLENNWTGVQNFNPGINLPLIAYVADDESVAYTGAGDGEAKLADLNFLRVAVENLRLTVEDIRTRCLQ